MAGPKSTASGLDPNAAAALSYLFGALTGLLFFLTEPKNKYVRFHALQSIFLNIAVIMIYIGTGLFLALVAALPGLGLLFRFLGAVVYFLLFIATIVLSIIMMIQAYQGEKLKLPVIGDLADQNT